MRDNSRGVPHTPDKDLRFASAQPGEGERRQSLFGPIRPTAHQLLVVEKDFEIVPAPNETQAIATRNFGRIDERRWEVSAFN